MKQSNIKRMLRLITTLFKPDPKYKRELKAAGYLLVAGYILLLAFVYFAFNDLDEMERAADSKVHVTFTTPKIILDTAN